MQKSKYYYDVDFSSHVIAEADDLYMTYIEDGTIPSKALFEVQKEDEIWQFDNREEFLSELRETRCFQFTDAFIGSELHIARSELGVVFVSVRMPKRSHIEAIFQVFERKYDVSRIIVETQPVKIFIGHGRDPQWSQLKDHLHEQHGFEVIAYEIGPRAGLSVKEVLEKMLNESSFALLVLTAEDIHADGEPHARENVIHELGLFQGRLDFKRAIALLEKNVKEFSNILGVNQIRFSSGNIRETYGDVLATIRREFMQHN